MSFQVKVFQQASMGENMIISIISKETPNLTTLASELLGKSVYIGWPHLKEAFVIGMADSDVKFSLINPSDGYSDNNLKKEDVKDLLAAEWNTQRKQIKET